MARCTRSYRGRLAPESGGGMTSRHAARMPRGGGFLALLSSPLRSPMREHEPRHVPAGLDASVASAHFVVHYDAADTYALEHGAGRPRRPRGEPLQARRRRRRDAERGLDAPPPDGDGKTDAYLSAPANQPSFTGGTVYHDTHGDSAYLFLTPNMTRTPRASAAAHEYMHVIQGAYTSSLGRCSPRARRTGPPSSRCPTSTPRTTTSTPRAGRRAPPRSPPLDCSYFGFTVSGEGQQRNCGFGYWQWSFMWRLSQWYGIEVMEDLWARWRSTARSAARRRPTTAAILTTSSRRSPTARRWPPASRSTRATCGCPALVGLRHAADHRAADDPHELGAAAAHAGQPRVVRRRQPGGHGHRRPRRRPPRRSPRPRRNDGNLIATGPNDQVRSRRAAGRPDRAVPARRLQHERDGGRPARSPPAGRSTLPFDPATTKQIVLPLVNDRRRAGWPTRTASRSCRERPRRRPTTCAPARPPSPAVCRPRRTTSTPGGRGNVDEATGCRSPRTPRGASGSASPPRAPGSTPTTRRRATSARSSRCTTTTPGRLRGCSSTVVLRLAGRRARRTTSTSAGSRPSPASARRAARRQRPAGEPADARR